MRSDRSCGKVKRSGRQKVYYALLVYVTTPYISVPGGLAYAFWTNPPDMFSPSYTTLFDIIGPGALAVMFGIASLLSWVIIMSVGPPACGVQLPHPRCFTVGQAWIYALGMFLIWSGLIALSLYFWNSGSYTGGTTYGCLAVAILARVAIITTGLVLRLDAQNS